MNNIELEQKIKEILAESNLLNLLEKAANFKKEYQNSSFYKKTKINLFELLKYSKFYYSLNLDELFSKIQNHINNLDLSKINNIFSSIDDIFTKENTNILEEIKQLEFLK